MNNVNENTPLDSLTGNIKKNVEDIRGDISSLEKISGNIKADNLKIDGNISPLEKTTGTITYGIGTGLNIQQYEGEYDIIPKAFEDEILNTKNKRLSKDITVKEIPYYETSNVSGGLTVYIAGHIDFG